MNEAPEGELPLHILSFTRTLRAAGLALGPGQALDAVEAARRVGIARREDFHAALSAALVRSPAQRELFDQAFHVHFRNPRLLERMQALILPRLSPAADEDGVALRRRLAQALLADAPAGAPGARTPLEVDAFLTASAQDVLRRKDFAEMSARELAEASALLRQCQLPFAVANTRRYRRGALGPRVDLRSTLQRAHRYGGEVVTLVRERPRRRPPPLVLICDISGSMARYTRMFLIFAHTLSRARERVTSFVFGTRLTNVTPLLRHADVDEALDRVAAGVDDWAGGTRIGECLREFNYAWSRRVLAQGAVVVLLTDGLEREPTPVLGTEMARLKRSCRRLVWLNPLLRYTGFEVRAAGIRAMLPHVHALRPAHDLRSLLDLGAALDARATGPASGRRTGAGARPRLPVTDSSPYVRKAAARGIDEADDVRAGTEVALEEGEPPVACAHRNGLRHAVDRHRHALAAIAGVAQEQKT